MYDNLLEQQFNVTAPNTAWVSDITYLWTNEGWVYLAAVKDLYSKEIVGYALNKRMTANLVCEALNNAIKYKRPAKVLIVHSLAKQCLSGSQYCSHQYRQIIAKHGFLGSMSRKGNCYPHCQNSCHPHLNNPNGEKGDNHGTIQCRTQTSYTEQTFIT